MKSDLNGRSDRQTNIRGTNQLMQLVMLGCLPAVFTHWYCFGWGTLLQIVLASTSALLLEAIILMLRGRSVRTTLADGSALLTGVLLGLSLPPLAPWWVATIGMLFAIIIAKQLYGGLGHNLFNPAMVGYVTLLIAFPLLMSRWPPLISQQPTAITLVSNLATILNGQKPNDLPQNSDAVTKATPLDRLKTKRVMSGVLHDPDSITGVQQLISSGWLAINLSFLFGGLFLLVKRVIQWHIPVSYLATLLLSATIGWLFQPTAYGTPLFHLLSGSTLFGAFFIATDPVTAATTVTGRLIFGGLIGLLIYLIRVLGGYPDGVAFAILLANMTVGLLDRYTQPCVYGKY